MVKRLKKPYSKSHVSSRKIRDATVGSHISKSKSTKASSMPTYSNAKKSKRAQSGMVDQVMPRTSTRETRGEYNKRVHKASTTEDFKRKRMLRTMLIALAFIVVALGAAALIGSTVFFGSASSRMNIADEAVAEVLVAPEEGEPYYTLIAGEFDEVGQEYKGPSMLMLARIDETNRRVSMIEIPDNTAYLLSDRQSHDISEAQVLGGDAYLIETVSDLVGVPIAHYAKVNREQFINMVDDLGGVTLVVTEEVDDPDAGSSYIATGEQTLNGEEALTFCRARNFSRDIEQRADNQAAFLVALGERIVSSGGFGRLATLDTFSSHIKTDLSAKGLAALADAFKGVSLGNIEATQLPGYASTDANSGQEHFYYDSDSLKGLIAALDEGKSIESLTPAVEVDPASFTITLRNGSGLTGGAKKITDLLAPLGYRIEETGNADSYVYEETLIIYEKSKHQKAAQSLVGALGIGRVIPSNGFYAFNTDVLIVLGKDWKPLD